MSADPILDAARAQVMAVGVRRTTLTDIAARAGVSRMTVYRRYPDVATVLQALMTREFGALVAHAASGADDSAHVRERVVHLAVHGAEMLATHPLFVRLLDVDPELLLPYVTERMGQFQLLVVDELAERLAAGIAEGSVRAGDPRRLAAAIELALRGYVLAAHSEAPADARAHREDLGDMLDAFLRP